MTPTETANLPAGRELDALVAERVLGCKVLWEDPWPICTCPPNPDFGPHACEDDVSAINELARYSTDWNAAAKVIEAMWAKGYGTNVTQHAERDWHVAFLTPSGEFQPLDQRARCGETFPLAVCRAALAVVEAKIECQAQRQSQN